MKDALRFLTAASLILRHSEFVGLRDGIDREAWSKSGDRRPSHYPALCTNATAYPQRGHHRTTSHTLRQGTCRPGETP
jgi:hypothetical protein